MPQLDREQKRIVRLIRAEGRKIRNPKLRRVYERAAVQTGLVESNLRNLNYGDADSQGWRQERASLYENPTNLRASIRRFRQEFEQHYDPGERSYEVAAQVQRPREDLRGRYREEAPEANQILRQIRGNPAGSPAGPAGPRYETVPGVDNSQPRQLLMQQYLLERGKPNALLQLQAGLTNAQDVPETRRRVRGSPNRQANPRGKVDTSEIRELFWNGQDAVNIDNGRRVQKGFVSGHTDHAHAAFKNAKLARRAARLAVKMDLSVREYSPMDKVDPVHTEGSFHFQKGGRIAMDVSGPRMGEWANRVARGDF